MKDALGKDIKAGNIVIYTNKTWGEMRIALVMSSDDDTGVRLLIPGASHQFKLSGKSDGTGTWSWVPRFSRREYKNGSRQIVIIDKTDVNIKKLEVYPFNVWTSNNSLTLDMLDMFEEAYKNLNKKADSSSG